MDINWAHDWSDESFGRIFDWFHNENPEAWDRMKHEKRESRQPQRTKDLIDFLIEHDISIIRDVLEYVLERRKQRYARDMAYLDSESSNIPPEIQIAVMSLLDDHSFYSKLETELQSQDEHLKMRRPPLRIDEETLKRIKGNMLKKKKREPKMLLLPEPPIYRWARQSMKKSIENAMEALKKYRRAQKIVSNDPPEWLTLVDGWIDLNEFLEIQAQLDEISPNLPWELEYPAWLHIVTWAYMSTHLGFVILKSREFVDFIISIDGWTDQSNVSLMVRKNKVSIEKCIEFLRKLPIHKSMDLAPIREYLNCLLLILSTHESLK